MNFKYIGATVARHDWRGVIIAIDPNLAEDGTLWATVRLDDGAYRYCPISELRYE